MQGIGQAKRILNEVLSITAQESCSQCGRTRRTRILNEVLSITAQESGRLQARATLKFSSMKS